MPLSEKDAAILAAAYQLYRKREKRTAQQLIKAEGRALGEVRVAARSTVALSVASAETKERALYAIRAGMPRLKEALASALTKGRRLARRTALEHSTAELEREGIAVNAAPVANDAVSVDAIAADTAAASVSSAWGTSAAAEVVQWQKEGGPYRLPGRLLETVDRLDGRLRRAVTFNVANAFNEERGRLFDEVDAPGVFRVWSAVLDGHTCQDCWRRDGMNRPVEHVWTDSPPLHPFCRCVWEFVHIPHPERREDTDTDYGSLKAELRDLIREGRSDSGRHAGDFIRGSQKTRSPVELTKAFDRINSRR